MGKPTTADVTGFIAAPATVTAGSPVSTATGIPTRARGLVSDQLVPALRTAYIRATPVVIDARGRVQDTVEIRVIPAVHAAGDRLGPVVTAATLRAGAGARAAGTTLNAHARPVTAEAARRGRNALDALLGSDLTPAPVAVPVRSRGRRLRRGLSWLAVAGAVSSGAYGAWLVRTRRAHASRADTAGDTAATVVPVTPAVADLPDAVPDLPTTPVVVTIEAAADDLGGQPGGVDGDPDRPAAS